MGPGDNKAAASRLDHVAVRRPTATVEGQGRIEAALVRAVDVLERAGIEYALIGGLASAAVRRRRRTRDVDLFVPPDSAVRALEALGTAGFRTERTDEQWLYKAFADEVMIDLIFSSKGDLVLDAEMLEHRRPMVVRGRRVLALAPEDLVVIKALAAAEHVPRHWYDAIAILENVEIGWAYLARRARPHAARVLSLLLYAVSADVRVPESVLRELFECANRGAGDEASAEADHHLAAQVRQALASDPRLGEVQLAVSAHDHELVVSGEVATETRQRAVEEVVRGCAGARSVRIDVHVSPA
jgi:predicted nucleotidyltransferase